MKSDVIQPEIVENQVDTTVYVDRVVKVPKELNDFGQLILSVTKDIKESKQTMKIVSDNFPLMVNALDGVANVKSEVKTRAAIEFFGLLVADIANVFIKR